MQKETAHKARSLIFEINFKLFQLANNLTNGLRQNIEALFQRIHRHLQLRHDLHNGITAAYTLHDEAVFKRLVNDCLRNIALKRAKIHAPQQTDAACRDAAVNRLNVLLEAFIFSLDVVAASQDPATYCILALVLMGAPSTTKLVPREVVVYPEGLPASRIRIVLGLLKSGSLERPPGNSSRMSVKLEGCRCSMACFSITEAEARLFDS